MRIFFLFVFGLFQSIIFAQSQDLVTMDDVPVDFSNPWNIVLYIVMPLLLVIFYIYWNKQQRKAREEASKKKQNKNE
ncbi:MAG: hypothetical protein JJU02_05110 [Cryomorphaceae bacterium]|nr:hypothetical protein [Cryomorphaceae bacterium]